MALKARFATGDRCYILGYVPWEGTIVELVKKSPNLWSCKVYFSPNKSINPGHICQWGEDRLQHVIVIGDTYQVIHDKPKYNSTIVKITDECSKGIFRGEVIDPGSSQYKIGGFIQWGAKNLIPFRGSKTETVVKETSTCTCDLWRGCTCGAIEPYKLEFN